MELKKQIFVVIASLVFLMIGFCGCTGNVSDNINVSVYYSGYLYKRECPCPDGNEFVFILSKYNTSDYPNYLIKKDVENIEIIKKQEFYTEEDIGAFSEGQYVYITGEEETGWAEGINKNSTNFIKVILVNNILTEEEYENR